ncbi:MAG TPA: heme exporter protein CcmD [Burkholderiales bacterium]
MNWGSWSQFWHMGGYGFYVWGSYGLAALAIALEVWALARRARRGRAGVAR